MEGLIEIRFVYENGAETVLKGRALEQWYQGYLQGQLAYKAMQLAASQHEAQAEMTEEPEPQGVKTLSASMSAEAGLRSGKSKKKDD
jgi:hypothetical protein